MIFNEVVECERSPCCEFSCRYTGDLEDFQDQCDALARKSIATFFRGKSYYCGGPIPKAFLNSMESVTEVVSNPFMEGIDKVYQVLSQRSIRLPRGVEFNADWNMEIDIFLVLHVLEELRQFRIPVEYQAGMTLLYLKLCHGLKLPKIEYDVSHLIR